MRPRPLPPPACLQQAPHKRRICTAARPSAAYPAMGADPLAPPEVPAPLPTLGHAPQRRRAGGESARETLFRYVGSRAPGVPGEEGAGEQEARASGRGFREPSDEPVLILVPSERGDWTAPAGADTRSRTSRCWEPRGEDGPLPDLLSTPDQVLRGRPATRAELGNYQQLPLSAFRSPRDAGFHSHLSAPKSH